MTRIRFWGIPPSRSLSPDIGMGLPQELAYNVDPGREAVKRGK
jgi:hypothetical protein